MDLFEAQGVVSIEAVDEHHRMDSGRGHSSRNSQVSHSHGISIPSIWELLVLSIDIVNRNSCDANGIFFTYLHSPNAAFAVRIGSTGR